MRSKFDLTVDRRIEWNKGQLTFLMAAFFVVSFTVSSLGEYYKGLKIV